MNRRCFLAGAALLPQLGRTETEPGFLSLFDGSSLRGWSIREGPESAFYVENGDIVVHPGSNYPTWLRSDKQYENFDFRGEFFIKGWMNSGIYLHAPEHGRNTWIGMNVNIFHQKDAKPEPQSMGAILPVVPPLRVNVRNQGEWNTFRILMDWPSLKIWTNDELVQDLQMDRVPELRWRLRRGYLGFESLSYPIRFRNLRVRELPDKEKWQPLYQSPEDFAKWRISEGEGKAKFEALGPVLRADGLGHLATVETFRDFVLHAYVRHSRFHNGGVLFRTDGHGNRGRRYEIQLHDVEGAHFPTGSLYSYQRATYPKIEPEKWWLLQMVVQGPQCLVRINGETVMEYDRMQDLAPGHIELQAHQAGRWTEFKQIRIQSLG